MMSFELVLAGITMSLAGLQFAQNLFLSLMTNFKNPKGTGVDQFA
jgi:hypothetical protein